MVNNRGGSGLSCLHWIYPERSVTGKMYTIGGRGICRPLISNKKKIHGEETQEARPTSRKPSDYNSMYQHITGTDTIGNGDIHCPHRT